MRRAPRGSACRVRRATATSLAAVLLLTACSGDDGQDEGDQQTSEDEEVEPGVVVADRPPPARWTDDSLLRVDEVARDGDTVTLAMTFVARSETTFDDSRIRLVTNAGLELPQAEEQERTLPAGSFVSLEVVAEGLDADARTLDIDVMGREVATDLPADGETLRYETSPVRQVGLVDAVMRDASPVQVLPYTVRTEGVVTEVTFTAHAQSSNNPDLCRYGDCHIEDGSGNTFPFLGGWYEFPDAYGSQVRGTLRFLGQIGAEQTEHRLVLGGSSGFLTTPNPNLQLDFDLPTAADTPLRVAAANTYPDAFEVDETVEEDGGTVFELGRMSFHDDRIQLEVTATAPDDVDRALNFRGETALVDPSGHRHPLTNAADGGELSVDGSSLTATLVFLGPLAAGVEQLDLEFARRDAPTVIAIDLPERPEVEAAPGQDEPDASDDADEGTGTDDGPAEDDEPLVAELPGHVLAGSDTDDDEASTEPEPTTTVSLDIRGEIGTTEWNPRGVVATVVDGREVSGGDTVDPDEAADAEASLEDLGAERTPDGLVVTLPETVLFDFDSAELAGDADDVIGRVGEILQFYSDVQVEVRGHTDDVGEDDYNQGLSEDRAGAVVDALVAAGVSGSQLTARGFGAEDPVVPNETDDGEDDPDGRQQNRRVEIVLRE